jgi:hypothetical protein
MDSTASTLDKNPYNIDYVTIFKGLFYVVTIITLLLTGLYGNLSNTNSIILIISTFLSSMLLLGLFFNFPQVIGKMVSPMKAILILFVIILILIFNNVSSENINEYAYLIFPTILIFGIGLFYLNIKNDTSFKTNFITKESLKTNICILFICLLSFVVLLYKNNPDYLKSYTSSIIILFILLLCFGFLFLISVLLDNEPIKKIGEIFPTFKNTLIAFSIFTFVVIFSIWLATSIQNLSNTSNVMSFLVNLILFLVVFALIYRIISVTSFYKKSPLLRLFVNTIFYIPCLFYGIFEKIYEMMPNISGAKIESPSSKHVIILFAIIFLYLFYFIIYPYISVKISKQGGLLLVNDPVSIYNEQILASYQNLNQTDKFDYKFGLSFWLYLHSHKPHTNKGSDHYTSVLNYGDKPNILYNPVNNTLRVTMKIDSDKTDDKTNYLSQKSKYDENGNVILYERTGILLQKWNNIIINYNGGTFDIFYNAELVKTHIEVVPYMNYDNLVIGTDNGLYGSICNVNYFKNPISIMQIYYLYNLVKTSTPPVVLGGKVTVFDAKNDYVKIPTTSFETSTIETAIDSAADVSTTTVNEAVKDLTQLNPYQQNYLSLKWYFMGNKDNQTI